MSQNHYKNDSSDRIPFINLTDQEIIEFNNALKRNNINLFVAPINRKKKEIKKNFLSQKRSSPISEPESNLSHTTDNSKNLKKAKIKKKMYLENKTPLKLYLEKIDKHLIEKEKENNENQKKILIKDIMDKALNFTENELVKFCNTHKLKKVGREIGENELLNKKYIQLQSILNDIEMDCEFNNVFDRKKAERTIRQEIKKEQDDLKKLERKIKKNQMKNKEEIDEKEEDNNVDNIFIRNNIGNIDENNNQDDDSSDSGESISI